MRHTIAALAFAILIGVPAMAQSADANTQIALRNKAVVQASFDAWRARTGGPFALFADEGTWTIVGNSDAAGTYPSREAFMTRVIGPFNARMSQGLKPKIRQIRADGDLVVILFDAAGVARDGRRRVPPASE